MSKVTITPYAATIGDGIATPVRAYMCEEGTIEALAVDAKDALRHYYIVVDDEEMVCGYRILADEWYDASDAEEEPGQFAARLFAAACND